MYTGTLDKDRKKPTDFKSIRIQLASPEKIREWSYGEVMKPETINRKACELHKDGKITVRINDFKILKRKLESLENRVARIEKALEATRNPVFLKEKA